MTAPSFTDLEKQMISHALAGLFLANSDDEYHAWQHNSFGAFSKALEKITTHRFGPGVYSHATACLEESMDWEAVCQQMWHAQADYTDQLYR